MPPGSRASNVWLTQLAKLQSVAENVWYVGAGGTKWQPVYRCLIATRTIVIKDRRSPLDLSLPRAAMSNLRISFNAIIGRFWVIHWATTQAMDVRLVGSGSDIAHLAWNKKITRV